MQIDIETSLSADFAFSNAERDPLLAITLSDSTGWEEIIVVEAGSPDAEPRALKRLCSLIIERDPDVIEGHNIFKFDLPYLAARASKLGISLFMGRDGSFLSVDSRLAKLPVGGGHYVEFPNYRIRGRHIVDTYLLAQLYDQAARSLENFKLKDVARALGVAEKNRVLLAGGESIMHAYHNNRDALCRYALADVRETRAVASLLSRSYFVQSQMFPYNYQNVITRGAATKVDSLFLREYLRRGRRILAGRRTSDSQRRRLALSRPRTGTGVATCRIPCVCSWNAGKTMLENSSIPTPKLSAAARCQSKTMQIPDPAYHAGRLPARRRSRLPKPRGRLRTSSQVRNSLLSRRPRQLLHYRWQGSLLWSRPSCV